MYGSRKVYGIRMLRIPLLDDYGRGNQFREVVHSKLGKDFLADVLHLFCVEMDETEGIFELAERGFNPPAFGIEALEHIRREFVSRQIGNNGFKRIRR